MKETRDLHSAIFQQRSMKKIEGIYYVILPFFDNEFSNDSENKSKV